MNLCGLSTVALGALAVLLAGGVLSLGFHVKDVVKAGIAYWKAKYGPKPAAKKAATKKA